MASPQIKQTLTADDDDDDDDAETERHYSTIGIGKVFAAAMPAAKKSLVVEIAASVKERPEDFVVREVRSEGTASLDLDLSSSSETVKEKKNEPPVVSKDNSNAVALSPTISLHKFLKQELPSNQNNNIDQWIKALSELYQQAQTFTTTTTTGVVKLPRGQDKKFRQVVHCILRRDYPLLRSSTQPECMQVELDDRFFSLHLYLSHPVPDLVSLYKMYRCGYDDWDGNRAVSLRLHSSVERKDRRLIHQTIQNGSNRLLETTTTTTTVNQEHDTVVMVRVTWSRARNNRLKRKRDGGGSCEHVLFVVKKTNQEHYRTTRTLAKALKCGEGDIGWAGMKDMRAVTFQFCTVPVRLERQLERIRNDDKSLYNVILGQSTQRVAQPLNKGDLLGNHFVLTLCNLQAVVNGQDDVPLTRQCWKAAVTRIQTAGFINFFGPQRVGQPGSREIVGIRPFEIGQAMVQHDFARAVDWILTGRRLRTICERDDVQKFRTLWRQTHDLEAAWKVVPPSLFKERALLKALRRDGGQPLGALRSLTWSERTYYVSSFQSFLWNQAATLRMKLYGSVVVAGDLIRDDKNVVRLVREDEVSAFAVTNVVLPLPGRSVEYPTHKVGAFYQSIQDEFMMNQQPQKSSSSQKSIPETIMRGSYRHLLVHPQDLVSSTVVTPGADPNNSVTTATISFSLPPGSFATSLLRELMLTTVDRQQV